MSRLEVAVAGAGAGKTYDLCETVHEAVKKGLDPSRLLATTFTKKAAAELKGRLQAKILEAGGADGTQVIHQAEKLEFAAIGTVHGVALQLVRKFALHLGLSPRLEVLPEGSERDNLQQLFIRFGDEVWQAIGPLMERLDLREEQLRETLFHLVELKRNGGIGEEAFRKQMEAGRDCLMGFLGTPDNTTATLETLRKTLKEALDEIEKLTTDTTKETKNGIHLIKELLAKSGAQWSDYPKTSRLKAGKKSGADNLMEKPRALAQAVRRYKELHEDVKKLYEQITEMALLLDNQYRIFKQANCYADYTDLLFLLLELLEKPELEEVVRSEYDLILVDEVQDSQPVEYAIFERLRNLSKRSRWVGDPKQAIYSFKGADPKLLDKYRQDPHVDNSVYSKTNRRSQAGLVHLVGKVFEGILDDSKQETHHPAERAGIERWLFDSTNEENDIECCVSGVQTLMREGIPPGDIAILARENDDVNKLAKKLREYGIPTLSASAGLLAQRECALVVSAMRLVADHSDTLAAANILHHMSDADEPVPSWALEWPIDLAKPSEIGEIIRKLQGETGAPENDSGMKGGSGPVKGTGPLANKLKSIIDIDARNLSPYMVMVQVMRVLEIQQGIGYWTEPSQRAGCLDSLLQMAKTYEEQSLAKGKPATLSGLVIHLEELKKQGKDLIHPVPGGNAIHVLTYHKAKGLEWPVVVLTSLDYKEKTKPWYPKLVGSGDIANPLAGRQIRYWQWPFGYDNSSFPRPLVGTELETAMQSSEEISKELANLGEESKRLLYVGFTRAQKKLVLAHRKDKPATATSSKQSYHSWLDKLKTLGDILDKDLEPGKEHDLKGHEIDTTFLLRSIKPEAKELPEADSRWLGLNPLAGGQEQYGVHRYHSPSQAGGEFPLAKGQVQGLEGKAIFPKALETDDFPTLGLAVHAFLGAIPSLAGCKDEIWIKRAQDCLVSYGMSGFLTPEDLVQKAKVFRDWVINTYPGAKWHVEVPLSSPRSAGGQWTGTADLILELPSGDLVLIDHKSSPIKRENCESKALTFFGQIAAYREILELLGNRVLDTFIHFPLACQIVNLVHP